MGKIDFADSGINEGHHLFRSKASDADRFFSMNFAAFTFRDVFTTSIHPLAGGILLVYAITAFVLSLGKTGNRQHWVLSVFAMTLITFFAAEWFTLSEKRSLIEEHGSLGEIDPMISTTFDYFRLRGRILFFALGGISAFLMFVLLWWPQPRDA